MDQQIRELAATWMRGGTSKCWIFESTALPEDERDAADVLARVFGSPDPRQVDGVGGGTSTTSKAIIVDPPDSAGVVRYRFAQVSVDDLRVEWGGNCGNCASALALYAVEHGMARREGGLWQACLVNTGSGLTLNVEVPVGTAEDPRAFIQARDPGTYYAGQRVDVRFVPASWSSYGDLFPTGNTADVITFEGKNYRTTLLDAGAPVALVWEPHINPDVLDPAHPEYGEATRILRKIRSIARSLMAIPGDPDDEAVPKVGVIGKPREQSHDICARMLSMSDLHPAVGVTTAVALAVAATRAGTAVSAAMTGGAGPGQVDRLVIGTPTGNVTARIQRGDSGEVQGVHVGRSARTLARALLDVPMLSNRDEENSWKA